MIVLTKLDGRSILVNEDQIQFVEANPDTVLVMTTGARLMVKESLPDVVDRSADYRRMTHSLESRIALAPQTDSSEDED